MPMNLIIKVLLISVIVISNSITSYSQEFPNTEKEFKALYAKNIKKSRISGVYIPKDINDAFTELDNLSTDDSKAKFRSGTEDIVADRLHRALGQWMVVNWNFYEGSRLSHHIKGIGVTHPEDMGEFMIRVYHRYLSDKPLDSEMLATKIEAKRKQMRRGDRDTYSILEEKVNKPADRGNED